MSGAKWSVTEINQDSDKQTGKDQAKSKSSNNPSYTEDKSAKACSRGKEDNIA